MLKLQNLHVRRGDFIVAENINLQLERGKIYTILGPNGTGKSAMIKTIFGELPFNDEIFYQDQSLHNSSLVNWRKPIGYMPQDSSTEASLTAL